MKIPNDAKTTDRTKSTIAIYAPLWEAFESWCEVTGRSTNRMIELGIQLLLVLRPEQVEQAGMAFYKEVPITLQIRTPDEGVDQAEAARIVEQGMQIQRQVAARASAATAKHRRPA